MLVRVKESFPPWSEKYAWILIMLIEGEAVYEHKSLEKNICIIEIVFIMLKHLTLLKNHIIPNNSKQL